MFSNISLLRKNSFSWNPSVNNFVGYLSSYLIVDELSLHFISSAFKRLIEYLLSGIK